MQRIKQSIISGMDFSKLRILQPIKHPLVSDGPHSTGTNENLTVDPRYSTIKNNFMTIHFRLRRLSIRILPLIAMLFIVIYWLIGIFVTHVIPQYEQYGHC